MTDTQPSTSDLERASQLLWKLETWKRLHGSQSEPLNHPDVHEIAAAIAGTRRDLEVEVGRLDLEIQRLEVAARKVRRESAEQMREAAAREAQQWKGLNGPQVAVKIRALQLLETP